MHAVSREFGATNSVVTRRKGREIPRPLGKSLSPNFKKKSKGEEEWGKVMTPEVSAAKKKSQSRKKRKKVEHAYEVKGAPLPVNEI